MTLPRLMSRLSSRIRFAALPLAAAGALAACGGADTGEEESAFSSDQATLLTFEFDAEFVADSVWNVERTAENQLLYTIGHLNGDNSVGRFDKLEITDVERTTLEDGKTHVRYHAVMPVAWGSKTNLPETYQFRIPKHVDSADFETFTEKYMHSCVDWSAHDVDSGSMWYYYRPERSGCSLDPEDIVEFTATVTVSEENSTGKYPEYHKVWEDNRLTVVAIFGKYEDGATTGDAGISAYNSFVRQIKSALGSGVVTDPADIPSGPGVDAPDITFRVERPDGRVVEVVALLVDNVRTAGPEFDARYEGLSGDADLIFYNGHAGLGANVRALARKGEFVAGKYQIFFMNGCDSFAYVDGHLVETRAQLNPDDPQGSRYMDMITNVMPSYFSRMDDGSMAIINGLLSYDAPMTYEQIFKNIDRSEVVVVTGEEDNVFEPGFDPERPIAWAGIEEAGAVAPGEALSYELGELPAGTYQFTMTEDASEPGGDADLYLAVGRPATTSDWDERPYEVGSNEQITLKLDAPATVHLMVLGYEHMSGARAAFQLAGQVAE
jgi:hypothetical protein